MTDPARDPFPGPAASAICRLDVYGDSGASLADALDDEAFPGFDRDGVWLLGLRCGTCLLPAPVFLGRIEVR